MEKMRKRGRSEQTVATMKKEVEKYLADWLDRPIAELRGTELIKIHEGIKAGARGARGHQSEQRARRAAGQPGHRPRERLLERSLRLPDPGGGADRAFNRGEEFISAMLTSMTASIAAPSGVVRRNSRSSPPRPPPHRQSARTPAKRP
jgi:hypothetical protein